MLMLAACVAFALAGVHQGIAHRSRLSGWVIGIILYLMLVIVPALLLGGIYLFAASFVSSMVFASQEFSRFAEALRFAGEEKRLKEIEMFLTDKAMEERGARRSVA